MNSTALHTTDDESQSKKRNRDNDDVSSQPQKKMKITSQTFVPDEIILRIFSYIEIERNEISKLSQVSRQWSILAHHDILWKDIYYQNKHLVKLQNKINDEVNHFGEDYGHYSECATWKPSVAEIVMELATDREEQKDKVDLETVLQNFGAPLCKGTIELQYDLISSDCSLGEYGEMVRQKLCVTEIQRTPQENHYEDMCLYDLRQYKIYKENQEARRRDDGSCIIDGNFEGVRIYADDEMYDEILKEGNLQQYFINNAIQNLARMGGIKYYEPETILIMEQLLKEYIGKIIEEAAKKFDGVELNYTSDNYTGIWTENENLFLDDEDKDDELDTDLKINNLDIVDAIKTLFGKDFSGPFPVNRKLAEPDDKSTEEQQSDQNMDYEYDEEELIEEARYLESTLISQSEENDINSNEEESEQDENNSEQDSYDEADFIDDSELESIDINNLGNSLRDQLIKVSIRVHEEVYGKERTHNEKLYLKNWFGNGNLMFRHAAEIVQSDVPYVDDDFNYEGKTEQDIIDHDMKEDITYYGYSLYEEEEEEYEDEVEDKEEQVTDGTEYRLQRLLRQESFRCIREYDMYSI
jgi:hypothetical protein